VVIANAKLFGREYQIAETLQSTLIGVVPERLGRLVFGHKYLPALDEARVGGDLFDVVTLPNGKVALVVADVSGKGIQAAVHTAMIRYMARAFLFQWPDSPAATLDLLNRAIFSYFGSKAIVTVFCAIIDPNTGWMAYANAGHPPAIALTRGGKQQVLFYRTGIPIGYSEDSEYDERELMLTPGDLLILYTDGIIEARHDRCVLTIEGLQDIVFKYAHLGPREMVEMVCEEAIQFANHDLRDDIAIIAAALEPVGDRWNVSSEQRDTSVGGGSAAHS
jgi:serine phosphatase RsbU (regulator of sigma subunit)